jgi:hypothetical protein
MRVEMRKRQAVRFAAFAGLALALAGCDTIRDAAGITKDAPDEFAVVTKQPLIIPPEFNLHPPRPGAAPANQLSPTDTAQSALFPDDPNAVAASITGNYSQGEKLLIASAGAANANDSIRQVISADNKSLDAADEGFTNQLLFGANTHGSGALDADAEKARLDSQNGVSQPARPARRPVAQTPVAQTADQSVAQLPPDYSTPTTSSQATSTPGTLPDLNGNANPQPVQHRHRKPAPKQKDSDGWFDGIF